MEKEMYELAQLIVDEIKDYSDILLIAGATGSGKSTLAKVIQSKTHGLVMSLDDYFLDENDLKLAIPECGIRQWDTPDCYDWVRLKKNLEGLLLGRLIDVPIRSRFLHKRIGWHRNIYRENKQLIILDGLYALHDDILDVIKKQRVLFFGIFLDISPELRWDRKHARDIAERNENPDTLRLWFDEVIRPAEIEYLDKQKGKSNKIVES